MGNMSYCRFENTARDLQDCLDVLFEKGSRALPDTASRYERDGLEDLLELCNRIVIAHTETIEEALEAWEADDE